MESNDPKSFTDFGSLLLVCGDYESGRSTFMWSLEPDDVINYHPKFVNDRKKLIKKLSSYDPGSIVGIETDLPNIQEKMDPFLNDILLSANIRNHMYMIELKISPSEEEAFLLSTRIKFAKTVIITKGIERQKKFIDGGIPRFSAIGATTEASRVYILSYCIAKYNDAKAIVLENINWDVTKVIEGA